MTEKLKVNMFEMKCLRSRVGVTRRNRIWNEVIRPRLVYKFGKSFLRYLAVCKG